MTLAQTNPEYQAIKGENSDAFSVLAAELQTATTRTAGVYRNNKCRGVIFIITTANKANAASFTPQILGYDASGTAFTLAAFTAITAAATTILIYYPAVLTGFSGTEAKVGQLPRIWSFKLLANGNGTTDAIDTKVDAMYLV
jgi:hypothetical protein